MSDLLFAFDKSARRVDADGRLHIERSHISKAAVNPYYGREIPGYQELGLVPDKVYRLLRDPVELERAAPTFARLPILSKHVPVTVDAPRPDLVIGAVGSEIEFVFPYLDADTCVWDSNSIVGIENNQIRAWSCAYRYVPIMEPGIFEGQAYDGKMTKIEGNHLALVEVGRAGSDVIVSDSSPFNYKESAMKMTKLGKALFAALSAASPALAADSALPALVGPANRKNFNKSDIKAKLLAMDATLNPQQLDNVIDALLDVEQEPKAIEPPQAAAADASPADKLRQLLAGKVDGSVIEEACALFAAPAEDSADYAEKKDDSMKKEDVAAAMDGLRKEMREAEEARRDVRNVVGDVIGMDSAADVYGFALDHLKIDRKDVQGAPALRALFKVASAQTYKQAPQIAQDAGGLLEKFPAAGRFRNA